MSSANALASMLNEDLVYFDYEATDSDDLITKLASAAIKAGYATDGYAADVIERERLYPTGLPVEGMKVAVPHAMVQDHVIKSTIVIAKLAHPVIFKEMGDGENNVPVEMVFMLVVKGTKGTLEVLTKLIGVFADPMLHGQIERVTSAPALIELLPKLMEQVHL